MKFLLVFQIEVCDPYPHSLKLEKGRGSSLDPEEGVIRALGKCLGCGVTQIQAGDLDKLLKHLELHFPQL